MTSTEIANIGDLLDINAVYGEFYEDFDREGVDRDYLELINLQVAPQGVTVTASGIVYADLDVVDRFDSELAEFDWKAALDAIDLEPILVRHHRPAAPMTTDSLVPMVLTEDVTKTFSIASLGPRHGDRYAELDRQLDLTDDEAEEMSRIEDEQLDLESAYAEAFREQAARIGRTEGFEVTVVFCADDSPEADSGTVTDPDEQGEGREAYIWQHAHDSIAVQRPSGRLA